MSGRFTALLGEGVEISRIWAAAHFLVFDGTAMVPLSV